MVFDCPHLHKYTCDDSGCVTEYVWGICVELCPGYLYDCRTSVEVESIKPIGDCWGMYPVLLLILIIVLLLILIIRNQKKKSFGKEIHMLPENYDFGRRGFTDPSSQEYGRSARDMDGTEEIEIKCSHTKFSGHGYKWQRLTDLEDSRNMNKVLVSGLIYNMLLIFTFSLTLS